VARHRAQVLDGAVAGEGAQRRLHVLRYGRFDAHRAPSVPGFVTNLCRACGGGVPNACSVRFDS